MPDDFDDAVREARRLVSLDPGLKPAAAQFVGLLAERTGTDIDDVLAALAVYIGPHRANHDEQVARQALAGRLLGMAEGIRAGVAFDELAEAFAALAVQCDEWAERWA